MSAFIFCNQDKVEAIHRAELPRGIQNKGALLNAVSDALCFPDYFGGNWDALEECIRDLSWLPEGDVVLRHGDLPLSMDRSGASTYLSILKGAIEKWGATGRRRLHVIFPPEVESVVHEVLPGA